MIKLYYLQIEEKFNNAGAPMWLGHLADPRHWEREEERPKTAPAGLPALAPKAAA